MGISPIYPPKPTSFIFDNEDILLELDGSNNITARFTHGSGIDEPLIMEKAGASFFYHADGLGSITEITDSAGVVKQQYTYSSFGKIESQLDPNFVQPYTFTGREFDPETELYHYRERQYDWKTGRFNQVDPFGGILILPQSLHGYRYAANNPVKLADPFGLYDVTFSFGFHVPVSPGLAVGPVVSSTIVGYSNNPSAPITPNPTDVEIAVGVIADIGVAVGISDLSGTGGACAGPSINFGLGTRAGVQIVPRLVQDRSKSIFNPLRYIDGISLGIGAGVALPVNVSQPLNVGQPQPAR
jgi:RHS repeat-associated protein